MFDVRNPNHLLLGICLIITQQPPQTSAAFTWICGESPLGDNEIDVNKIKPKENFAKMIKLTMIVYGRATADIMGILRSDIASLVELEKSDASTNLFGKPSKEKEQNMVKNAKQLVLNFRDLLKSSNKRLSYRQKAFHTDALQWIIHKLDLKSKQEQALKELRDTLHSAINDPAVAVDYLKDIPSQVSKIGTISALKERINNSQHKTIETFETIQSFGIGCLQNSNSHSFRMYFYTELLDDYHATTFRTQFNCEPFQMLMYMDYGAEMAYNNNNAVFRRISADDLESINLCVRQGFILKRFKYVLLFYHQILQEKFQQLLTPQDDIYDLIFPPPTNFGIRPAEVSEEETYSEAFKLLTHFYEMDYLKTMHMKGLSTLYLEILHEAEKRMIILNSHFHTSKTDIKLEMFYDKLLEWLNDQIPKVETADTPERNALGESTLNKVEKDFEVGGFQEVVDYIVKIRDRLTSVTKQNAVPSKICNIGDLRQKLNEILAHELPGFE